MLSFTQEKNVSYVVISVVFCLRDRANQAKVLQVSEIVYYLNFYSC